MELDRSCSTRLRPRAGESLSLHAVAADRVPLPLPADLLRLRRPGARTPWALGRRLDDSGKALALPPMGKFGTRLCAECPAAGRALVSAMALRPLARNQSVAVS